MTLFSDLPDVAIEQIHVTTEITLTLRAASPTAACPCCGTVCKRVHSRYSRKLHDLPSSGRPVHLLVQVRRFTCPKPTCPRKIFAEQFVELARPHAQRTKRLQEVLSHLGLAVGGQAGARLGSVLGLGGSRDTILRLVRQSPTPASSPPRVVGVDEWAWKRRRRYGTVL